MRIGEKIRILREIKGISSKEMSADLEMTQAGYLKIERDEVDINTEKIEKIASILGIKPHELLSFDEKYVFNNYSTNEYYNAGLNTVNYHFPEEMKKLYEDKIKLLEEKIEAFAESKKLLNEKIEVLKSEIETLKNKDK